MDEYIHDFDGTTFQRTLRRYPCGRCGYPLPNLDLRYVVTTDDRFPLVESARKGMVNYAPCAVCGFSAWLEVPFIFVDLRQLRAVFVRGVDGTEDGKTLLEAIRHMVTTDEYRTLTARLQAVRYYYQIPEALALTAEQVELECRLEEAYEQRRRLEPRERLEQLLKDTIEAGSVLMMGFEISAEFCLIVDQEFSTLSGDDTSTRAQALRQLREHLRQLPAAQAKVRPSRLPHEDVDLNFQLRLLDSSDSFEPNTPTDVQVAFQPPDQSSAAIDNDPEAAIGSALYNLDKGRFDTAQAIGQHLLEVDLDAESGIVRAWAHMIVGAARSLKDYRDGHEHLYAALEHVGGLARTQAEAQVVAYTSERLALIGQTIGDYEFAVHYFRIAVDHYKVLDNADGYLNSVVGLATCYVAYGEVEAAYRLLAEVETVDIQFSNTQLAQYHKMIAATLAELFTGPPDIVLTTVVSTIQGESPTQPNKMSPQDSSEGNRSPAETTQSEGRILVRYVRERKGGGREILAEELYGDPAIEHCKKALKFARAARAEKGGERTELSVLLQLAVIYDGRQLPLAARAALSEALRVRARAGIDGFDREISLGIANEASRIGDVCWRQGQHEQALEYWAQALASLKAHFIDEDTLIGNRSVEDPRLGFAGLRLTGLLAEKIKDRELADRCYQSLLGYFENRRSRSGPERREAWQKNLGHIFGHAIRNLLAMQSGDEGEKLDAAMDLAERSRARHFTEQLEANLSGESIPVLRPGSWREILRSAVASSTYVLQYILIPEAGALDGYWLVVLMKADAGVVATARCGLDECKDALDALVDAARVIDKRLLEILTEDTGCDLRSAAEKTFNALGPELDRKIAELSEIILREDISNVLSECEEGSSLVIVPDAYLYNVPFPALVLGGSDRQLVSCFRRLSISPSLASLELAMRRDRSVGGAEQPGNWFLDPIGDLGIAEEMAQNISIIDPLTNVFAKNSATSEHFLGALHSNSMLYYIGHGTELSLRLSDDVVSVKDITQGAGAIPSAAVVLACSSGHVKLDNWPAREPDGFGAALHRLGVSSVVCSARPLWTPVATNFALAFASALRGDRSIGHACNIAILANISGKTWWSSPYFWGWIRTLGVV